MYSYVCVCEHVCVYACECVCVCACMCLGTRANVCVDSIHIDVEYSKIIVSTSPFWRTRKYILKILVNDLDHKSKRQ